MSEVTFTVPDGMLAFAVVIVSNDKSGEPVVSREFSTPLDEITGQAIIGHALKIYGDELLNAVPPTFTVPMKDDAMTKEN